MRSKKICAMFLAVSIAFYVGCKNKKEVRSRIVKETDPYFSCEEIRLNLDLNESEGKELQKRRFSMVKVFSNCVLVAVEENYVMPDEFEKEWNERYDNPSITDEDRLRMQEEFYSYRRSGLAVFDLNGSMKGFAEISTDSKIEGMIEDSYGNPKVVISVFTNTGKKVMIYDISSEGTLVNEITLKQEMNYIGDMIFLKNGNLLCNDSSSVLLYNSKGEILNEESIFVPIRRLLQIEEKYYVYFELDEDIYDDTNAPSLAMYEIDPSNGKKMGEKIDVKSMVHFSKLEQKSDGLYTVGGNGIQKVDLLEEKKSQMVLNWSDTDCDYSNRSADNPSIYIASNSDIYMTRLTYDGLPMAFVDEPVYVCLLHLHREERNPHAGKSIIYLAYYNDPKQDFINCFIQYLNKYNTDPMKKTRIVLTDYSVDSTLYASAYSTLKTSTEEKALLADQVYLDILSGDGPDILLNFGSFSQFNTERVLVDLNTLIDGNTPLDRSLLYDNIVRAYERDGKLYQIPMNFAITGMIANKDFVEDRTGWTYDEFRSISQSLPENVNILGNVPQSELLETLLNGTTSHFLDYDNRKVKYDDPEFGEILDLVKNYGVEKTSAEIFREMTEDLTGTILTDKQRFDAGMIVAMNQTIHRLSEFGNIISLCGGNVCFIGNPNVNGSGAQADSAASVAITQACPFKEEAWDFIKYLFDEEFQLSCAIYANNFPVNRKAFDAMMDLSLEDNKIGWERAETETDIAAILSLESAHLNEEHVATLKIAIESIRESCSSDPSAMMIIQEEAPGYFTGQRTVDEVVNIIQKRAAAVVQERG